MLFCSNSAHFLEIQLVCDRRTDGRTEGGQKTGNKKPQMVIFMEKKTKKKESERTSLKNEPI